MYYPKDRIKSNLYTSGGEFKIKSNNKDFKGYYISTKDGKYFTGKELSPESVEIIKVEKYKDSSLNTFGGIYNSIKKIPIQTVPKQYLPSPTDLDYQRGFILRYFMKRKNGKADTIKEISKDEYDKMKINVLYKRVEISWKITGKLKDDMSNPNMPVYGIEDTNKRMIDSKLKEFEDLDKYLTNLSQFAKVSL